MNPDTLKLTQTIPLPLFNRNPGYLCKTLAEVAATEARYTVGDIRLTGMFPVRRDWAAVQLSYLESLARRDARVGGSEVAVWPQLIQSHNRAAPEWKSKLTGEAWSHIQVIT